MLEQQPLRLFIALMLGCALLPGCSYMTKSGRQQAAYRHYVQKYSHNRMKQQQKLKVAKAKVPPPPRSQDAVNGSVNESPQSVSSNEN